MDEQLIESWSSGLVTLSYVVSVMGAYSSLIFVQYMIKTRDRVKYLFHLLCASVCFGGVGIWAMHFIGMQALDVGRTIVYDPALTVASLLAAVAVTLFALLLMSWRADFSSPSPLRLSIGGIGAGLGVSTMHYLGMFAMMIDHGHMHYRGGVVSVSIIIGIAAATAGLWILIFLKGEFARLLAAFIMALAVCSMHYCGMMAMEYEYEPAYALTQQKMAETIPGGTIGLIVAIAAGLLLFFMMIAVITHMSYNERRLRALGRKLWRRVPDQALLPEKITQRSRSLLDITIRSTYPHPQQQHGSK